MGNTIRELLSDLTGKQCPFPHDLDDRVSALFAGKGIGYSQMNELLLFAGFNRIPSFLFQFLVDGRPEYESGSAISSRGHFREGVDRLRKLMVLRFGSIVTGFAYFSDFRLPADTFKDELSILEKRSEDEFLSRHDPVVPPTSIQGEDTYYLGYVIEAELAARLENDPSDQTALDEEAKRKSFVDIGRRNHEAYLASDHLDVYVATSMRARHEYQIISRVVAQVFGTPGVRELKLRYFDPTQAYCFDRIEKGLAEALMLKRAKCTLYLAQETDTLGKDSELASTLAQGKPVVAYVPRVDANAERKFVHDLLEMVKQANPTKSDKELLLEQLRIFAPEAAWSDVEVIKWISDPDSYVHENAISKLGSAVRKHYDKRADTLKAIHPLGIQVDLDNGVANGVIVARSPEQCAELIKRIVTNQLEFKLEPMTTKDGRKYLALKETITDSIFRVVSGDTFLTNAFWSYYLE